LNHVRSGTSLAGLGTGGASQESPHCRRPQG